MQGRIVEITSDGAHISVTRGFLAVNLNSEMVGQVAIDDMAALIIRGHGATLSVNICARLADANIPIVICGTNQSPSSVIWPVNGHYAQGLRMQAQAATNKPKLKRLWAQIIRAKIETQSNVLGVFNLPSDDLNAMARRVKSGDTDNLEAQAARRYWPRLMGDNFRRDRDADGMNAALNYGYAVLRAAVARSILAAGLHPSLSIQHQSRGDALRLADDLMEPFRPWVDLTVKKIACEPIQNPEMTLSKEHKQKIISVLTLDLETEKGASPVQNCIDTAAQSLAQVFLGDRQEMDLATRAKTYEAA